jgi:hypothetical protein
MDSTLAETVGWPQLVGTVRTVWLSMPPDQRPDAVIFTADYSEAGAINELGRDSGLPTAVSGQNTEWWWGPGNPDATTVVAVAPSPRVVGDYATYLHQYFSQVRVAATLTNPYGIHNIESGGPRVHLHRATPALGSTLATATPLRLSLNVNPPLKDWWPADPDARPGASASRTSTCCAAGHRRRAGPPGHGAFHGGHVPARVQLHSAPSGGRGPPSGFPQSLEFHQGVLATSAGDAPSVAACVTASTRAGCRRQKTISLGGCRSG